MSTYHLTQSFREMIEDRLSEPLDQWLQQVEGSQIVEIEFKDLPDTSGSTRVGFSATYLLITGIYNLDDQTRATAYSTLRSDAPQPIIPPKA